MESDFKRILSTKLFNRYFVVFLICVWLLLFVMMFTLSIPSSNQEVADVLFGGYSTMTAKAVLDVIQNV
jgi:cell division septal protein FtsQ